MWFINSFFTFPSCPLSWIFSSSLNFEICATFFVYSSPILYFFAFITRFSILHCTSGWYVLQSTVGLYVYYVLHYISTGMDSSWRCFCSGIPASYKRTKGGFDILYVRKRSCVPVLYTPTNNSKGFLHFYFLYSVLLSVFLFLFLVDLNIKEELASERNEKKLVLFIVCIIVCRYFCYGGWQHTYPVQTIFIFYYVDVHPPGEILACN